MNITSEIAIQSKLLAHYESRSGKTGGITHAFGTRRGGVSEGCYSSLNFSHQEGDSRENVYANKGIVAAHFQIPAEKFFSVTQVHRDGILIVASGGHDTDNNLEYDGLLTSVTGVALCVKTADCVPILLFEPDANIVGAVHAGWRGTALGIVSRAIELMVARLGAKRGSIIATIGPAIGECCYEVDETVYARMNGLEYCFLPSRHFGRWMFDIKKANYEQLLAAGMKADNVEIIPLCTSCNEQLFFSHRRDDGKTGRMLNFIALKS